MPPYMPFPWYVPYPVHTLGIPYLVYTPWYTPFVGSPPSVHARVGVTLTMVCTRPVCRMCTFGRGVEGERPLGEKPPKRGEKGSY